MEDHKLLTENLKRLFLQFVLPAVISMVLAGTQSMIDGLFLGRYASTNAMASVNIAIPYMQMIIGCAMIICSGTISFLGRTLGEGKNHSTSKAQNIFRSSVVALIVASAILMGMGIFANKQMTIFMGANDALFLDTSRYIFTLAFFVPVIGFMLLFGFTARFLGKPHLYLVATIGCLLCNIGMDYIAVKILQLGAMGAALATGFSYVVGLLVVIGPILKKDNVINIYQGHFQATLLRHTVLNGSSEGVTSLATAVTAWLFNTAMMRYAGEGGVAAFTVINYISNFVILVMFGVADGISTLVSYNYGARNLERVRKILQIALILNFISGTIIFLVLNVFSEPLIGIFIQGQEDIVKMAVHGAHLYSISFLLCGFNIVQSGYHTSIGNAGNSAIIAGSRGLIFIFIGMMILPKLLGIHGVWLTVPFAEICTICVCIFINQKQKEKIA